MKIKKLRNRKNIQVNLRNKKINSYYKSSVKTLSKKLKILIDEYQIKSTESLYIQVQSTCRFLTSKLDKAVKKGALKKNTVSRKKSFFSFLLKKSSIKV